MMHTLEPEVVDTSYWTIEPLHATVPDHPLGYHTSRLADWLRIRGS